MPFLDYKGLSYFYKKILAKINNSAANLANYATLTKLESTISELHTNRGMYGVKIIDLTDTSVYSEDTWYPCVSVASIPETALHRLNCYTRFAYSGTPSWATHASGFSSNLDLLVRGWGWGTTYGESLQLDNSFAHCDVSPTGYTQLTDSTQAVLYLRGGAVYHIQSEFNTEWTVYTSTYTGQVQAVSPQTTYPGVTLHNKVTIKADIEGYLPLDGSKAMTGALKLQEHNGEVGADGNYAFLRALNEKGNTGNFRVLQLLNKGYEPDIGNSLRVVGSDGGSTRVLTDANSAAVAVTADGTTPPDINSYGLWVY